MSGSRTKVVLGDADVADICNGRGRKGAVGYYAKKYGISTQRVRTIWGKHFGGTTLEDHRSGLKVPLPGGHQYTGGMIAPGCAAAVPAPSTEAAEKAPKAGRKAGKFVVDGAPEFVPAQGAATRAKPVRSYKPPPPPPTPEPFNEELAAGEMRAGNNSGDLAHIMERLLTVEKRSGDAPAAPRHARRERHEAAKESAEQYTEEASTEPSYADEPDQSSAYEASDVDDAPQLPVARQTSSPQGKGPMGYRPQVREPSSREPSEHSLERSEDGSEGSGADYPGEDWGVPDRSFGGGRGRGAPQGVRAGGGRGTPATGFAARARGAPPSRGGEEEGGSRSEGREGARGVRTAARPQRTVCYPIPRASGSLRPPTEAEIPYDLPAVPPVRAPAGAASTRGHARAGGPSRPASRAENHWGHRDADRPDREPYQPPRGGAAAVYPGYPESETHAPVSYIASLKAKHGLVSR